MWPLIIALLAQTPLPPVHPPVLSWEVDQSFEYNRWFLLTNEDTHVTVVVERASVRGRSVWAAPVQNLKKGEAFTITLCNPAGCSAPSDPVRWVEGDVLVTVPSRPAAISVKE
jgi:hypothetical protein